MKNSTDKRKITVQVWRPVLNKLNALATNACLNRDAYLDVVFANEAAVLPREVSPDKNSEAARMLIKRALSGLKDLAPVSFNLSITTADAIDQACSEINVGRDSFINRVLFLLVAKTEAIEQQWGLKLSDYRQEIFDLGNDIKGLLLTAPLIAIRSLVTDDPFFAWRTVLSVGEPETLHRMTLGRPDGLNAKERGLLGLNVYLPDRLVPGTEAQEAWDEEMKSMFDLGI